ncbi:MAG: hypothetical protein GXP44_03160 [bacterium]|nr:hypothetical protein [bacterium]
MGKKILKLTVAILAGAALVFAFMGYSLFMGENQDASVIPLEGAGAGYASGAIIPEGEEILKMLATLRSIKLDASFFENETFKSLVDFSVELVPEKAGRLNPFAPFGKGGKALESSEL